MCLIHSQQRTSRRSRNWGRFRANTRINLSLYPVLRRVNKSEDSNRMAAESSVDRRELIMKYEKRTGERKGKSSRSAQKDTVMKGVGVVSKFREKENQEEHLL